jgi:hypothetical protein
MVPIRHFTPFGSAVYWSFLNNTVTIFFSPHPTHSNSPPNNVCTHQAKKKFPWALPDARKILQRTQWGRREGGFCVLDFRNGERANKNQRGGGHPMLLPIHGSILGKELEWWRGPTGPAAGAQARGGVSGQRAGAQERRPVGAQVDSSEEQKRKKK